MTDPDDIEDEDAADPEDNPSDEVVEGGSYEPTCKVGMYGALTNKRAERLALILADAGTTEARRPIATQDQWVAAGGKPTDPSRRFKNKVLRLRIFRERLGDLMNERHTLEQDPVWGRATWMIDQGWRWAFCEGNISAALDFARMRLRVAEKSSVLLAPPEEVETKPAKGPGAPLTPSTVDNTSARDILLNGGPSGKAAG